MKESSTKSWKVASDAESAAALIDYGVVLKWTDMKAVKRQLTFEDQEQSIRLFAQRLCERHEDRLAGEIIVESLLIWLVNAGDGRLAEAFFDELFNQPDCPKACRVFIEVSLANEVIEHKHAEQIFSMAVALVCELGLIIKQFEERYPGEFEGADVLLEHVATYLLSISNNTNSPIRLSLMRYFGALAVADKKTRESFNKILTRFGQTVLEQLFELLFAKKTEALALQYLMENIPFLLAGDAESQRILHLVLKQYLLKRPERFTLFMHTLADHVMAEGSSCDKVLARSLLQHYAALFQVVSGFNQRPLGREVLLAIQKFAPIGDDFIQIVAALANDHSLRPAMRNMVSQLSTAVAHNKNLESLPAFRSSKRGRKPAFSRIPAAEVASSSLTGVIGEIAKAS